METKELKFIITGEDWQIKELGDIFGNREIFNEKLAELNDFYDFNSETEYLEITVKRMPK